MMKLVQDHARLGKEIMGDISRVQEHHRLLCTRMKLAEELFMALSQLLILIWLVFESMFEPHAPRNEIL